jgi:hypothetical protein
LGAERAAPEEARGMSKGKWAMALAVAAVLVR